MPEHRREKRIKLSEQLEVFDLVAGTHVGMLGNISRNGLMLVSEKEFPVNGNFQFRIDLPEAVTGRTQLDLGVHCLWSQASTIPNCWWTGFEIIDVAEEAIGTLEVLAHVA